MSLLFEQKKLKSYLGKDLVSLFKDFNAIVAGGAITSLFTNSEINDIDVYFRSKEDIAGFIECVFEDSIYIMAHTDKATLFVYNEIQVQLIHYDTFENVDDVFDAFDFTACMGAYDFKHDEFKLHNEFMKHNAQKLIRYNKKTDYPLISLLRVKKYQEKGYEISKPEMFRVVLSCMNLDITSYDELKEQLGGMYGVNYDKMFEDIEDEEFSLDKAIDHLENLHLNDEYFIQPVNKEIEYNNVLELIHSATGLPFKYFEADGREYKVGYNGDIDDLYNKSDVFEWVKVDVGDLFDETMYKYVKDNGYKLVSFFDGKFEYVVGDEAVAKDKAGLFLETKQTVVNSKYGDRDNRVLIEVKVNPEDFNGIKNNHLTFKKCKVVRVLDEKSL